LRNQFVFRLHVAVMERSLFTFRNWKS
jgi:hypothetical protein